MKRWGVRLVALTIATAKTWEHDPVYGACLLALGAAVLLALYVGRERG